MKTRILKESTLKAREAKLIVKLNKHDLKVMIAREIFIKARERYNLARDKQYCISERLAGTLGLISSCKDGKIEVVA